MTPAELSGEVQRIGTLELDALRAEWLRRYNEPIPLRSVAILRMLLAWRIQAAELGGLERATRRNLARKGSGEAEGLNLGHGARLTRVWKGQCHEVIVEHDGFRWEGRSYRSLSAAATAIAGTRWNGPRFFGLRDAA